MQIKILSVENVKVKTYFQLNVVYESQWGNKTMKIFSFANPAVYAILKDAQSGDQYEITTGKDAKDYTIWTQATKIATSVAGSTPVAARTSKTEWVPDADRQRLIVKQSCLAQAIQWEGLRAEGIQASVAATLELADRFVAWVYDVPELADASVS